MLKLPEEFQLPNGVKSVRATGAPRRNSCSTAALSTYVMPQQQS